ncbi:MAG: selenocysteine-specific translation elongation factor [Acidimicrobiales bacterium]
MHVVGTAGHVDHGKTTLIRHLTNTDPDRLAEEKRRGLTIDLGFASMVLPSGREVGFIDVPGHVRFLKNMLAGVGAIDACVFVVAANEGWKPQSEEHLRILDLLGVSHGIIALTKVESVDEEWRELAEMEIADHVRGTFLEEAEVVAVDALSGVGLTGGRGLPAAIDRMLGSTPRALDRGRPRLWIDRSFAVRGMGTVVTGTLAGGALELKDELAVEPGGLQVRVRDLESHGTRIERARPGRRLAVNLSGVSHQQIVRSQALVRVGQWHRCATMDASLFVLGALDHEVTRRGAYLGYFGSGEHPVRMALLGRSEAIQPGEQGLVRLRLATVLPLAPGDRYVLREMGRSELVGGGEILDVAPVLPISRASPDRSVARVVAERGWVEKDELARLTGEAVEATVGRWVVDAAALQRAKDSLEARVLEAGIRGLDIALLDDRQRALVHTSSKMSVVDGRARSLDAAASAALPEDHPYMALLLAAQFAPPPPPATMDRLELRELVRRGLIVERDGIYFAAASIDAAAAVVASLLSASPDGISASALREALGTTRRFVLPLLAILDASGVTRRRGDLRIGGPRLPPNALNWPSANHEQQGERP